VGQEGCNRKEVMDTPVSTNQKKNTWQRLKRSLEEEHKDGNGRAFIMGKRNAGEVDYTETGDPKKLKQDDSAEHDLTLKQAVAVQQPRRAQ